METDSPQPAAPDQWANSFDFQCFKKFKLGGVRIAEIFDDHIILGTKSARRHMTMIIFKRDGIFRLHAQNIAHGPLELDNCSDRNLVIAGDLQRVLKAVTMTPTRRRPRRRSGTLPLFPAERQARLPDFLTKPPRQKR